MIGTARIDPQGIASEGEVPQDAGGIPSPATVADWKLRYSVARILAPGGIPVGAAFVVDAARGLLATCAHVVREAGSGPGEHVPLDFVANLVPPVEVAPAAPTAATDGQDTPIPPARQEISAPSPATRCSAFVEPSFWRERDAGDDVALLRLDGPLPPHVVEVLLGRFDDARDHKFLTFGFPHGDEVAVYSGHGMIQERFAVPRGDQPVVVVQLASVEVAPVERGFSGGPVLDLKSGRVVGMITTHDDSDFNGGLTAHMTPTEALRAACPLLQISDRRPYRHLDPFRAEDVDLFHGRAKIVDKLADLLARDRRLLVVLGPSGSGKSSLVHAGLLPHLSKRNDATGPSATNAGDALNTSAIPSCHVCWHTLTVRPADSGSCRAIAQRIASHSTATRAQANVDLYFDTATWRSARWHPTTQRLDTAIRRWAQQHPGERMLLVLDQFEEMFVSPTWSHTERQAFVRQVLQVLEMPSSLAPIAIVLTLRDDFYSQFADAMHDLLRRARNDEAIVDIPPLNSVDVEDIIHKPARHLGLRFQDGLVDQIVRDTLGAWDITAEAPSTILPMLEVALTQLWARREDGVLTFNVYNDQGGVSYGLVRWADEAFAKLPPEQRALGLRVMAELVHLSPAPETQPDSRRPRSTRQIVAGVRAPEAVVRVVIARLAAPDLRLLVQRGPPADQRLHREEAEALHMPSDGAFENRTSFTRSPRGTNSLGLEDDSVELIHDILVRDWPPLKQAIQDDRLFQVWYRDIAQRVEQRQSTGLRPRSIWLDLWIWWRNRVRRIERWMAPDLRFSNAWFSLYHGGQLLMRTAGKPCASAASPRARIIWSYALRAWRYVWPGGQLLRASDLATARDWLIQRRADIDPVITDFVEESLVKVRLFGMLVALIIVWFFGMAVFAAWQRSVAIHERDTALQQGQVATQERGVALQQRNVALSRALAAQADSLVNGQRDVALLLGVEAEHLADSVQARTSLLNSLTNETSAFSEFKPHTTGILPIDFLAMSPDDTLLATAPPGDPVQVWDMVRGQQLEASLPIRLDDGSLAFSPDNKELLINAGGTMYGWDVARHRSAPWTLLGHSIDAFVLSPDGKVLAIGSANGTVQLWHMAHHHPSGAPSSIHAGPGRILALSLSRDGAQLATGECTDFDASWGYCFHAAIRVWDLAHGQPRGAPLPVRVAGIQELMFAPDTSRLAIMACAQRPKIYPITCTNESILQWGLTTHQLEGQLTVPTDAEYGWSFVNNRLSFVTGQGNGLIQPWDPMLNRPAGPALAGPTSPAFSFAYSPDGRWLMAGTQDGHVWLWDRNLLGPMGRHFLGPPISASGANNPVFSPDGGLLATSETSDYLSLEGSSHQTASTVQLWDARSGRFLSRFDPYPVRTVAFNNKGDMLATAQVNPQEAYHLADGSVNYHIVQLWDLTRRQPGPLWSQPFDAGSPVSHLAFSPDDRLLTIATTTGTVFVADLRTGHLVQCQFSRHGVLDAIVNPGDKSLTVIDGDNTVWVWDMVTKPFVKHRLPGPASERLLTADGKVLLIFAKIDAFQLWNAPRGRPLGPRIRTDVVKDNVALSPDGTQLVADNTDGTIQSWDVATGQSLGPALNVAPDSTMGTEPSYNSNAMPELYSLALAYSPDGSSLVTQDMGGDLQSWDVNLASWLRRACLVAGRNLTHDEWRQYLDGVPYRRICPGWPIPKP